MVIALVLLGYILRRLSKQGGGKSPQSRGGPVPNEHPARTAAAQKTANGKLDIGGMRSTVSQDITRASELMRHGEELTKVHDKFQADLRELARKLQEDLDQTVLRQVRMHRYAVRVNDDGEVEKLFVLNA